MDQLISLPLSAQTLAEYASGAELAGCCQAMGCSGIEGVWAGEPLPESIPQDLHLGYHLTFYPDWLDFWREDRAALARKFGGETVWRSFYGGGNRDALLQFYRADLERAVLWGARYVVFHVSDISVEEGFTYRWLHSHEEVIDAAAEVINLLLDGRDWPFAFLVENQWWPGFTFTDPALTGRLLDAIHYPCKGILLDTGHLMNTNPDLATEEEGVAWIERMLDAHGDLCRLIRGVHLHQSLSGAFVKAHTGAIPPDLPPDYIERYGFGYRQVLQIDRHQPFHSPAAAALVDRIAPDYLVHELSAATRAQREACLAVQTAALRAGWNARK